MKTKNQIPNKTAGFTMIEILVSIFIMAVVGLAVGTFAKDIFSLNRTGELNADTQQEITLLFKKITAEIRTASQANGGAYALAEVLPTSFTFYSDTDNDGKKEKIKYFLDGTSLKKNSITPTGNPPVNYTGGGITSTLATNVTALTFNYYDTNYSGTDNANEPIPNPTDKRTSIRLVKITLTIDKGPANAPAPVTMTTQISIRNLKTNL